MGPLLPSVLVCAKWSEGGRCIAKLTESVLANRGLLGAAPAKEATMFEGPAGEREGNSPEHFLCAGH